MKYDLFIKLLWYSSKSYLRARHFKMRQSAHIVTTRKRLSNCYLRRSVVNNYNSVNDIFEKYREHPASIYKSIDSKENELIYILQDQEKEKYRDLM